MHHAFKPLLIRGRALLPVVQGGMGIGISARRLAGSVAALGAVGTIASIDLRHHHADLLARSKGCRDQAELDALNFEALHREVVAAKQQAGGIGMVAVNVMRAVEAYTGYVRQACRSGADAIVMGAGLPLDLPELTADYPDVALIPILSDARGIALLLKKWLRKGRVPDAIVIEHPRYAGGHLGAASVAALDDARFDFAQVLAQTHELFAELAIAPVPLIVAGGIHSHEQVAHWLANGASAVQLGTAFAVSEEGDAHPAFKAVLAGAQPEETVEFISVAGLPARAVVTPWLKNYLQREARLQGNAKADPARCTQALNCLAQCGLRDGNAKVGQFCIDLKLAAALRGEVGKGLFFRGASVLPFGNAIRPVRELIDYLLNGRMPQLAV